MDKQITVIEFTPCNIKLLSGYQMKDRLYVLQSLEGEILPLNPEGYPKKEDLKESLIALLATARKQLPVDIGPLVFLYPPYGFKAKEISESSPTGNAENKIRDEDYRSCTIRAMKTKPFPETDPIYLVPFNFKVDTCPTLSTFPLGKTSSALEVDGDVHFLNREAFTHYQGIVSSVSLKPYLQMVSTYSGFEYLTRYESERNYLILELQNNYTYFSEIKSGRLFSSSVIKENLSSVLERFSNTLGVSVERGKELMMTFGFLQKLEFEYVTDEGFALDTIFTALCKAFMPLLRELATFIADNGVAENVPVLITGTGIDIFGLEQYVSYALKRNARISRAKELGAETGVYNATLGAIAVSNLDYQMKRDSFRRTESDDKLKSTVFDR